MASKAVILSSIVLNGLLLRVGICCFIFLLFFFVQNCFNDQVYDVAGS